MSSPPADLEQTLLRQREESRLLMSVVERVNSGLLLPEICDHVYDSFSELLPYDRIGLALVDPGGKTVTARWARSRSSMIRLPVGYSAPLEGSSLLRILETGEPRILNDLEAYLREHDSESTRLVVQEGIRSSLTCPLIVEGRPIGFLFFSSTEPGTYADAHVEIYRQIASHISVTVEKGRLLQALLETKSRLVEANEALTGLAHADGLTGVPNRRFFEELYEREWNRAVRQSEPLSVILVDIDFFKQYNDLYGHLAGDECLKSVAGILSTSTQRGTDLVARFGGEEFVLVLPNTGLEGAAIMAERLRKLVVDLEIPHSGSTVAESVTISLGLAGGVPQRGDSPRGLLDAADRALYRAKEAGRNRVEPE
jgi:diguanylate cyclase (GGDEF)-like protein